MGIDDRRARERAQRRKDILAAAWQAAAERGWSAFSVEQAAQIAEIGRATVYSYFESIDVLVLEMAREALTQLEELMQAANSVVQALDVPVRLAQRHPERFELLFPQVRDPRPHLSSLELQAVRDEARTIIARLRRVAESEELALPDGAREKAAFVAAVSMAGATIPELRASTTLRHRFQDFCLRDSGSSPSIEPPAVAPVTAEKDASPLARDDEIS